MSKEGEENVRIVIKKKGGHGAHHGGAWKVAYADFVTAMMALFMVLWLLSQADMKLRQQIAMYFRNPGILPGGSIIATNDAPLQKINSEQAIATNELEFVNERVGKKKQKAAAEQTNLQQAAKNVKQKIAAAVKASPSLAGLEGRVQVQVTPAGLLIEVIDEGRKLLFDLSSSELKPEVQQLLRELGGVLGSLPNQIEVGGHTDARPFHGDNGRTNWDLSFERADAARKLLEANGLRSGQLARVLAYADREPLDRENPMADKNRRLSILAVREVPTDADAEAAIDLSDGAAAPGQDEPAGPRRGSGPVLPPEGPVARH